MFVVCDNMLPLSEACFYKGSFVDSVLRFYNSFPSCKSFNVYSDLRNRFDCKDFQFICTLSNKKVSKLASSLHGTSDD